MMQLQPYSAYQPASLQPPQTGLQGLSQVVLAIQQQLASVAGSVYVPPLSSCPFTAMAYFKWYKRYGIAYYEDGRQKPTITQADVERCLSNMKANLDILSFDDKVTLLREGYLDFTY